MTKARDGYEFAVEQAIEWAGFHAESRYFEGQAAGMKLWCGAATDEEWRGDKQRIQEARECAKTTAG